MLVQIFIFYSGYLKKKNQNNLEKWSLAAIVQRKNVWSEDTASRCFSFYFPSKPLVF